MNLQEFQDTVNRHFPTLDFNFYEHAYITLDKTDRVLCYTAMVDTIRISYLMYTNTLRTEWTLTFLPRYTSMYIKEPTIETLLNNFNKQLLQVKEFFNKFTPTL